jgi:hypothetical protein
VDNVLYEYLHSYNNGPGASADSSQYSAAIVNAIDFQSLDAAKAALASPRLSMSLHVLERGSHQMPGTKRVSGCL